MTTFAEEWQSFLTSLRAEKWSVVVKVHNSRTFKKPTTTNQLIFFLFFTHYIIFEWAPQTRHRLGNVKVSSDLFHSTGIARITAS